MASPANPSRNRRPFDSVSAANHPPSANSATADITNGRASRRSCFVSPGVTNRHSSYSSTGSAMAIPVATDTLNRIRNGSTTPVNTSLQPVGDLMTPSLHRFRYGLVIKSKIGWKNTQPIVAPTPTAISETMILERSSSRCSTIDIPWAGSRRRRVLGISFMAG